MSSKLTRYEITDQLISIDVATDPMWSWTENRNGSRPGLTGVRAVVNKALGTVVLNYVGKSGARLRGGSVVDLTAFTVLGAEVLAFALDVTANDILRVQKPKNIVFQYQYRDGANWKESVGAVFTNPSSIPSDTLASIFRAMLDGENFIAETVGLPTCYFDADSDRDAHGLHEFLGLDETDEEPLDPERTIEDLIVAFAEACNGGWKPVRKILPVNYIIEIGGV